MLEDLNQEKIDKAIESLIFLAKKRNRTIKGRTCTNSTVQIECVLKEVLLQLLKSILLITGVVEAKQRRDIIVIDIANTFV